jgi:hypothetical protein
VSPRAGGPWYIVTVDDERTRVRALQQLPPPRRTTVTPAVSDVDVALAGLLVAARMAVAAARLATVPGRVAVRVPIVGGLMERRLQALATQARSARVAARERLDELADAAVNGSAAQQALDRALASALPEVLGRSLAEHHVAQRVLSELVARTDVDEAVEGILDHPAVQQAAAAVADRVLQSDEFKSAVEQLAGSPELRAALASQSATLASETAASARGRAEGLDEALERTVRGWLRRPRPVDQ